MSQIRQPDSYWVSDLHGIATVNGRTGTPINRERRWVTSSSVRGEAIGDMVKLLTDQFYDNCELPLEIHLDIAAGPNHGKKFEWTPQETK